MARREPFIRRLDAIEVRMAPSNGGLGNAVQPHVDPATTGA